MSAIEVLKEWNNKPIIFDERFMTKEDYIEQVNLKVATQEALLALEKQEKLKEWLEKEIELRKIKHDCIAKQAYKSSEDLFRIGELETEVTSLKEVLERVGEQK
jgi:hypothetical protein